MKAPVVLFGVWLLFLASCRSSDPPASASKQEKPVPVSVVQVRRAQVRSYLELSADCEALGVAEVRSRVAGQVVAVHCREGDAVKAGAPLVSLEAERERLAVKKAEAALALAKLNVKEAEAAVRAAQQALRTAELSRDHAKTEYQRARSLREGGPAAISEDTLAARKYDYDKAVVTAETKAVELQSAGAALEVGREKVRDAELALQEATLNESYRTIRSPITGQVVSFDLHIGDYVSQGQKIARVENPEQLFVRFEVAQSDIAKIRKGQEVLLTTQAFPGKVFRGVVASVNRAADPQSGTIRARVDIVQRGELLPGLFVVGRIVVQERAGVPVVPREAVRYEGKRPYLWYVNGEHRARRLYVVVGIEEEDVVEIRSFGEAKKPPENIILLGNVREGSLVAVTQRVAGAPHSVPQGKSPSG